MVFRGYRKGSTGNILEHWVSPKSFAKRKNYQKNWGKAKREKIKKEPIALKESQKYAREHQKILRKQNPQRYILTAARCRAKYKGLPFNINVEDIQIPEKCPILGIPLCHKDGFPDDGSPALDRIIPSLGYVKGNIMVISHRANNIKGDASLEELRAIVYFLENFSYV